MTTMDTLSGYVTSSCVSLSLTASAHGFADLATILRAGELTVFWLLIWGPTPHPGATALPISAIA